MAGSTEFSLILTDQAGSMQAGLTEAAQQKLANQYTTKFDEARKERVLRVLGSSALNGGEQTPREMISRVAMNPKEAMAQLLKYVRMDPDGGILNLINSSNAQLTKVPALKKGRLEIFLAATAALRSVVNPVLMSYFALHMLQGYFLDEGFRKKLHEDCVKVRLRIPLEAIFVVCAVLELSLALFWIFRALYDLVCTLPAFDGKSYSSLSSDDFVVDPRYIYLSKFYLRDLPSLQNLSVLRLLAYAHPNLVTKNSKEFAVRDQISRAVLEKFLKIKPHTCSDEDISHEVAKVIVRYDHAESTAEERIEVAHGYISLRPYSALMALKESKVSGDRDYLARAGLDAAALDRGWRLRVVVSGESVLFGCIVLLSFTLGATEYFAKLCRCAFLLMDPSESIVKAMMFFFMLLNQSLGMTSVVQLLRWRVETFIFGGTDAVISAEERYVLDVYLAMLVEKVWNCKTFNTAQKLAVMLQLDDDDLQQLVIEEADHSKTQVTVSVRQFMHKYGHGNPMTHRLAHWVAG